MSKIDKIKEVLAAATPDWHDNGNEIVSKQNPRVGIGGFLKEEDNHLAAQAPEYITYLLAEIERRDKALEWANRIIGSGLDTGAELRYDPRYWLVQYHEHLKAETDQ